MVNVRTMSDKLLLLVGAGAAALSISCASTGTPVAGTPASTAAASSMTGQVTGLLDIRAERDPIPRLVVRTSAKPAYTSYSPQPDVFVLDLQRTSKAAGLMVPTDLPPLVASVSADEVVDMGTPLTRVTLRFTSPVTPEAAVSDDSVILTFPAQTVSIPAPMPAVSGSPSAPVAEAGTEAVVEVVEPAVRSEEIKPRAEPSMALAPGTIARTLQGVRTEGSGGDVAIVMKADGSKIEYRSFRLTNPERIVVDLTGLRNGVHQKKFDVTGAPVTSVRVSQFKDAPRPVTRVVLDMAEKAIYEITSEGGSLSIEFGTSRSASSAVSSKPRQDEMVFASPAQADSTRATNTTSSSMPAGVADIPTVAVRQRAPVVSQQAAARVTTHVINSADAQTAPTASPRTEDVFLDAQTKPTPTLATRVTPGESRTLSAGQKNYTGDPIDLSLKDADIKEVLRTFAQLTGLNIAIDPGVSGTVTVEFNQVPWDQALELILRQNGLNYDLQGSVMRIGTLERLASEQASTRKLEEDQSLNVPLQTVIKHLSYAKSGDIQSLLKEMASPRGKIVVDTRTNQLVITEIPSYLQVMLNLIETVDIPTPQVEIEARIVETTKNFLQQYGINWGFRGSLDPSLGSGTGLIFPSSVGAVGGPFNFGPGNPILTLTLGNVLGTFNLDVALNAAESEGLARIVSAPKVTTQDNQAAEIQSGIQIPIQTRVNFTTTIQYIDATLRLSVTPQVTAQDTVIMDISVQKVEPLLGLSVLGGQNSPLSTRRATTRLMVRDGGTAVIGGIYQATENDSQSRVPFLHQIPILGFLFKNHDINSRHDELLIFITPRILRNT